MDSTNSKIDLLSEDKDEIFTNSSSSLSDLDSNSLLNVQIDNDENDESNNNDDGVGNDQVESARLKFEEICESIDEEERRLQELEERRQKLELDMQRLQEEIEQEKKLFRQAIDAEITKRRDYDVHELSSTGGNSKIDPLNIDKEEIAKKLREFRETMQESQRQSTISIENDEEIERLKMNLASYKKTLEDTKKDKSIKQKKRVTAKIFQKHLEEVDLKCDEQIGKLATIQKSIENLNSSKETDV